MPPKRAGKRRSSSNDDDASSSQPAKRTRVASDNATANGLASIPVELLYNIMVLAANPELAVVNRHLHSIFHSEYTPPQVRAAYIISYMWHELGDIFAPVASAGLNRATAATRATTTWSRRSLASQASIHPLFDPGFQRAFNTACGTPTPVPARMSDPRELVHRKNLARIEWDAEKAGSIWGAGSGEGKRRYGRPPRFTREPLDLVLSFGICASTAVLDSFTSMILRIPTLASIAQNAMCNGRLRTRRIPGKLVANLQPWTRESSESKSVVKGLPRLPREAPTPASASPSTPSRLFLLVSQLDPAAPRPPEHALQIFLRVLFWHYSANVELVTASTSAGAGDAAAPPRLHFLRRPLWPQNAPVSQYPEETDALLHCASPEVQDPDLWVLRLLLRFERQARADHNLPELPTDQPAPAPVPGGPPAAAAAAAVQYAQPDARSLGVAVQSAARFGWLDGLRFMLRSESPDEVVLESRVCNEIVRVLWEEGLLDGQKRAREENVAAAPPPPAADASQAGHAPDAPLFSVPSALVALPTQADEIPIPAAEVPQAQARLPPPPVLFARSLRTVQPALLTHAVEGGQFEVVEFLMREHGLTPDMQTLRALERLRAKSRREKEVGRVNTPISWRRKK